MILSKEFNLTNENDKPPGDSRDYFKFYTQPKRLTRQLLKSEDSLFLKMHKFRISNYEPLYFLIQV